MRFELEPNRGPGNLISLPLVRKSIIALVIFASIGGLKKTDFWLAEKTYSFVKKAFNMEIDYQSLISRLQLEEKLGEGPLSKIWADLQKLWPGLSNSQLKPGTDNRGNLPSGNTAKQSVNAPVNGEIIAQYGPRIHPIYGDERIHTGIDLACPEGEPIRAVLDGMVIKVEESATYGKTVLLEHGNGLKTYYAHCSKILVPENKQVKANEIIAEVGNTGLSTNPHLHFEVWDKDVSIDPNAVFTFSGGGD